MVSKAVIFDLFGTLTESTPPDMWTRLAMATAAAIGGDPVAVQRVSDASVLQRMRGDLGDAWTATAEIARLAGVAAAPADIDRAVRARLDLLGSVVVTAEAVAMLQTLRGRVRIGVLSNCLPETAILWPDMGLDDLVDLCALSCEIGLVKPDPASFRYVLNGLGVAAVRTLYVTDGDQAEVLGARAVGLTPVLLDRDAVLPDEVGAAQISALSELLSLIG